MFSSRPILSPGMISRGRCWSSRTVLFFSQLCLVHNPNVVYLNTWIILVIVYVLPSAVLLSHIIKVNPLVACVLPSPSLHILTPHGPVCFPALVFFNRTHFAVLRPTHGCLVSHDLTVLIQPLEQKGFYSFRDGIDWKFYSECESSDTHNICLHLCWLPFH